jgi:hypothetical protein
MGKNARFVLKAKKALIYIGIMYILEGTVFFSMIFNIVYLTTQHMKGHHLIII